MHELHLDGCRTTPLGTYLKSLGLLRLVGEQVDGDARGWWSGDRFALRSVLDRESLLAFLTDDYRPTPLVAPWNGGSGFGPKDQQAGIAAIEGSNGERLDAYRRCVAAARALHSDRQWEAWSKEDKVRACRANLPDEAVGWIDATVVLTANWREFPPLLGTGGNDGRLEFSNNFMQRLAYVLGLAHDRQAPDRERIVELLRAALFAEGSPSLVEVAVGQFDPGAAGGVNSSPLGAAKSVANPWDFVLLMEGSLLFASGAARRLGAEAGRAAIPFMVDASPVGYPSGADENSRGELWAPLWSRPATAAEIERLIGEGRAEWRDRQSRTGLDVARAATSLGVDRGLSGFVRHAFVERMGRSMLAVEVGRVEVRARPGTALLAQLDEWLDVVRRVRNLPQAARTALRRVDAAQYVAATAGRASALQDVLAEVAALERTVARSGRLRDEAVRVPLAGLEAIEWLAALDDGTPEFRVAAAIASQHDRLPRRPALTDLDRRASRAAFLLRPVQLSETRRLAWSPDPQPVTGLGVQPLTAVLAAALRVRAVHAAARRPERDRRDEGGQVGVQTAFQKRMACPQAAVAAFVADELDEDRIARLLTGLLMLDHWPRAVVTAATTLRSSTFARPLPPVPAWALLAPFFHGRPLHGSGRRPDEGIRLMPDGRWSALLERDRVAEVLADALRRLSIARLDPAPASADAMARGVSGPRLAAALLVPITRAAAASLLALTAPEPVVQLATTEKERV